MTISTITRRSLASLLAAGALFLSACATSPGADAARGWTGAWGASSFADTRTTFTDQTLRLIVQPTQAGDQVRIRLSNAFGTAPLTVSSAYVGLSAKGAAVQAGTNRPLSFSGQPGIVIPAGAVAMSDPATLAVSPATSLTVSFHLPNTTGPASIHFLSSQTSYTADGAAAGAQESAAPFAKPLATWPYLTGVDVRAGAGAKTVVMFGDSITDGFKSTTDANARWPDTVARRLAASGKKVAVVNQAISGNRLIWDAAPVVPYFGVNGLARFDRDVLMTTGATHVIVLLGINDIGQPAVRNNPGEEVTADQLIAAHKQLIARAHARGLKIIGATLTPFDTYNGGPGYFSAGNERKRVALNTWIRTSGAYDGVIDFEAVTRDPNAPTKFIASFDSGDHLHPNDAGYKAMGDAVDLSLFD